MSTQERTPDAQPMRLTTSVEVASSTDARHRAQSFLEDQGVADDLRELAGLVLGEMIANVVAQNGTDLEVTVRIDGDAIRLAVTHEAHVAPEGGGGPPHEGGGWAMRLVDEMATRWGLDPRTDGRPGSVLWAEVLLT